MNENSLYDLLDETQVASAWKHEVTRFSGSQVFCPMCEVWHQNNTLCQMPMDGGCHE
jgi:hypothetical protein